MTLFLFVFGALFSIINPLGTVPVFISLTQDTSKKENAHTAFWASLNVLIILIISFFAGKYVLLLFGISINSLKIAGGIVIASSGFSLLVGKFAEHKGMKKKSVKKDVESRTGVALTPLATPMLAGPGTISLLITYNQQYEALSDILIIGCSILAVTISIYIILMSARFIVKALGASGINALSRIIGFIVIAIGIEYVTGALLSIYDTLRI